MFLGGRRGGFRGVMLALVVVRLAAGLLGGGNQRVLDAALVGVCLLALGGWAWWRRRAGE